ncbi:MAG: TIGR03960 family B12-binding radical SAM protein [Clostridia bacterium]|nr:TIGR03960 family B12-binding radical SAM protein [Clostridia bacterium]
MNFLDYPEILRSVEKPGRYTGGELHEIKKDKAEVDVRVAFCFPDVYEIGMSNLGMRILYDCLNAEEGVGCERVYAPWGDMDAAMRRHGLPLTALESGDPVAEFDIVAFTLQYELCYTTALHMMKLAGIPLLAADRGEDAPILLGGGPCAYNPEPIADFFDVFSIGEGEEALPELCRLYRRMKKDGTYSRTAFLREVSHLEGFYVPSLYEVSYREDGRIAAITPRYPDVPEKVRKRIIHDLDSARVPLKPVLPYIETVHDRVTLETYRGCIRGCRFCQAGMVYRPVRERSVDKLCEQAETLIAHTGYEEISLIALSISDYSGVDELTDRLLTWTNEKKVNLSLPSLRVDSFTRELMDKVSTVRMGGITFAPEAGTQRLRDVINKNVTEEDLLRATGIAFEAGKSNVKLYFMLGLPTETDEDLCGIAALGKSVIERYYEVPKPQRSPRGVSVTLSVACFIPKPFTPFQWEAQATLPELARKQEVLKTAVTDRRITYNYHEAKVSRIEAVLARGDRRLSRALLLAAEEDRAFDAWDECFSYEAWCDLFDRAGIDPAFYANRAFDLDEVLPWDMIDCGVTKEFLRRERDRAYAGKTTPSCAEHCSGCGASKLGGKNQWCP